MRKGDRQNSGCDEGARLGSNWMENCYYGRFISLLKMLYRLNGVRAWLVEGRV